MRFFFYPIQYDVLTHQFWMDACNFLPQWVRPILCAWVLLDLHSSHLIVVVGVHLMPTRCSADKLCVKLPKNTLVANCYVTLFRRRPPGAMSALKACSIGFHWFCKYVASTWDSDLLTLSKPKFTLITCFSKRAIKVITTLNNFLLQDEKCTLDILRELEKVKDEIRSNINFRKQ